MIRCKHVSNALAEQNWEDLSPMKKLALRFHVMFCAVCGRFNRQIMSMQSGTRRFTEMEDELHGEGCCLPKSGAASMKEALREAKKSTEG